MSGPRRLAPAGPHPHPDPSVTFQQTEREPEPTMSTTIDRISDGQLARALHDAFVEIKRTTPGTDASRRAKQAWQALKAEQLRRGDRRPLPTPGFFR